jgi:hypothetical protein
MAGARMASIAPMDPTTYGITVHDDRPTLVAYKAGFLARVPAWYRETRKVGIVTGLTPDGLAVDWKPHADSRESEESVVHPAVVRQIA